MRVFNYHELWKKTKCEWQNNVQSVKPSETTRMVMKKVICDKIWNADARATCRVLARCW